MNNKKTAAVILSVGIGTFMSALDSSVVNLAMPLIKDHFGVSLSAIEWVVTSYLLVASSLLLTYGRIADLYGHKKVYSIGFGIFIFGSLLCGLSNHISMLILSRVIQALGAGMLFSTGPAIITNAVPSSKRGKALSVTAVAVALGLCVGPVVGGTLSTLLGWRSIFYINLPIGAFGLLMVIKNLPPDGKKTSVPFDIAGSAMIFFALLLILLPLSVSGDNMISPAIFILLLSSGLLLVAGFIVLESKVKYPMLNLNLFRNRVFSASNAAALFIYMAQYVLTFLIPFYLENLRGYSALTSGLLYLPLPLSTMCIAPLSGSFSDNHDSRYISSLGALLMACGMFLLSFLKSDTSTVYIVLSMAVTGAGFGMFQTPNNSAIMGNAPQENRATASGTLATMRNIGMALGVAISGALFSYFQKSASALNHTGAVQADSAFTYALHRTFIVAAFIAVIAMAASFTKGRVLTEREKNGEK